MKKSEANPMNQRIETQLNSLHRAPRCGAKNRAGGACQCPAMRGRKRCRLHGGISPGAPRGSRNGNYRSGEWTIEAAQERKWLRELVKSHATRGQGNE